MEYSDIVRHDDVQGYLKDTVGMWLGLPAEQARDLPAMPDDLARTFLRLEEYENSLRDDKDRWEYSYSENFQRGKLWIPEVDVWVEELRQKSGAGQDSEKWPDQNEFAVCLTHDVDHVSTRPSLRELGRIFNSSTTNSLPSAKSKLRRYLIPLLVFLRESLRAAGRDRKYVTELERCVDLEKKYNFLSTYFYTVYPRGRKTSYDCVYELSDEIFWRGERQKISEAIKDLVSEGFEAGLHGSYFSAVEKEVFEEELERLSSPLGQKIQSTRQHYLHWDIHQTPQIHSETGILTDSTLGYARDIGFRSGTSKPYFMFDLRNRKIFNQIQVPLIVHDVSLFSVGALEFDLEMAKRVTKQILDHVKQTNGVLTVLFHPEYMSKPVHSEYYSWLLETLASEPAWITTVGNLGEYWRERIKKLGY